MENDNYEQEELTRRLFDAMIESANLSVAYRRLAEANEELSSRVSSLAAQIDVLMPNSEETRAEGDESSGGEWPDINPDMVQRDITTKGR